MNLLHLKRLLQYHSNEQSTNKVSRLRSLVKVDADKHGKKHPDVIRAAADAQGFENGWADCLATIERYLDTLHSDTMLSRHPHPRQRIEWRR